MILADFGTALHMLLTKANYLLQSVRTWIMRATFGKATAAGKLSGDTVQQMIDAGWNPLIQISQAAGETMEETQKRMSAGAISVQELQAAMEAVTTGTGQFAGGMESASQTTQGLISTLQDNVKSKIGEAFQSVSNILQSEVLPRAIEFVNSVNVDSVIESVNGLVSTFVELSPVIAAATTATLAYKAAVSISGVIDAVKKATEGQTIAQAALNAVMNANPCVLVATLIAAVGTALVTLYMTNEDFRNKINAAWSTVKDTISNVVSALKTFFTTTLPNAIDTAVDWLENLPDKFREVGANLLTGLWNGISDKIAWLKDKVSGVVNTIKGWFTGKDGFDEHSPSKWSKQVFRYVMEGGGEGLDAGLPGLMQSVGSVTGMVKSGLDFGTASVDFSSSGLGSIGKTIISGATNNAMNDRPIYTNVTIELDGSVVARKLFGPLRNEERRRGTSFVY
ncbi:phage tail protein [Dysosmobacter sp. Sow4_B12]|uniref:phage tail protein n=1 Tax=Dysosmobacter sp. Sow4_B12 TaxID=3438777 RepID=UPI003F92FC6E